MINITKCAQKYLKSLILKQNKKCNLRITIKKPGTEHAECKISYEIQQDLSGEDIKLQYDSFNIYIKKNIAHYLHDAEIDLIGNEFSKKLMLLAPNATHNKTKNTLHNNAQSNLLIKIQAFIDYYINPMLSMHGGKVVLVDLTKAGYAMIQFLGGCNGCTMSHITFKQSIEKKILHHFPDLNGVQDVTQHHHGKHSFL